MRFIMALFACLISMSEHSFATEDADLIAAETSFLEEDVNSRRTSDGEVRVVLAHQDKLRLLPPDPEEQAIVCLDEGSSAQLM